MDQAEQLRNIIKKQSPPKKLARVITVTSGKGGVGKSNLSVNLGIQMSRLGKRVIILDADFGLANVEVMLGIRPRYSLADLMFKGKELQEIITKGPENIGFISGGSGIHELINITRSQILFLTQKLYELDQMADVIIIDTGAGISDSVLEFVTASSEVLLIVTPEPTSITDAYALLKTLNRKGDFSPDNTAIKMIANRVEKMEEGEALFNKLNVVVTRYLKIPFTFLGSIPQDSQLSRSVMQQKPVTIQEPGAKSSQAFEELAAKLMNRDIPEKKRGMAAFFSHIVTGKR